MDNYSEFSLHCMLIVMFTKKTQPTIKVALTMLRGEHTKNSVKLPVRPTKCEKTYLISSVI